MIGWLRCALKRRSAGAHGIFLAAVLIGTAILVLAPAHRVGERAHRPSTRATTTGTRRGARQRPSLVSAAQIARARRVAQAFLAGYLRFVYGRASASSVPAVGSALRRQLTRERALVTPVERRRHPRAVSLTALAHSARVVVVTALVDDGGIANYALRLTVRRTTRGWLVSRAGGD